MAGNFNGYSGAQNSRPTQDAASKKLTALPLPEDFVAAAENVICEGNWSSGITTSKIRRLFSLLTDIYNNENRNSGETLAQASIDQLRLAQIRLLYEAGRDPKVKAFLQKARLVEYLKDIGSSRTKMLRYFHYMEALVACHKFYGGKEG